MASVVCSGVVLARDESHSGRGVGVAPSSVSRRMMSSASATRARMSFAISSEERGS